MRSNLENLTKRRRIDVDLCVQRIYNIFLILLCCTKIDINNNDPQFPADLILISLLTDVTYDDLLIDSGGERSGFEDSHIKSCRYIIIGGKV